MLVGRVCISTCHRCTPFHHEGSMFISFAKKLSSIEPPTSLSPSLLQDGRSDTLALHEADDSENENVSAEIVWIIKQITDPKQVINVILPVHEERDQVAACLHLIWASSLNLTLPQASSMWWCVQLQDRLTADIGLVAGTVKSNLSHQPPLESLQIVDTVTSLSRENVMYWRSTDRPSPPEATDKLEEALDRLHALVIKKEKRLDHVSVAMMIHQVAALSAASNLSHQIVKHDLVKRLLTLADECHSRFDANHIANIVWAMGKMRRPVLFVRLGESSYPVLDKEWNAQLWWDCYCCRYVGHATLSFQLRNLPNEALFLPRLCRPNSEWLT